MHLKAVTELGTNTTVSFFVRHLLQRQHRKYLTSAVAIVQVHKDVSLQQRSAPRSGLH